MRIFLPLLVAALPAAAPSGGRADVVEALLNTPATQMDVGVDRLGAFLAPVFAELGVLGVVVWHREDSRIEIRMVTDLPEGEAATWEPARRAAAAVRLRLGVDPQWGRLREEDPGPLADLFALSSAAAPPTPALAGLIRIRIAVHPNSNLPPTYYSADLLDDDVFLLTRPLDWGRR